MRSVRTNVVLLSFCLLSIAGLAQRATVKFSGIVYENGKPVSGVHVYVIDAGAIKSEILTDSTGKFQIETFFNKMIYIHFVKDGYVHLTYWANTRIRNMQQSNMKMEFSFNLIKQPFDGRVLTFKDPIERIKFNYDKGKFQIDTTYHAKVQPKLKEFVKSVAVQKQVAKTDSIN
jgi:hypothetical protein